MGNVLSEKPQHFSSDAGYSEYVMGGGYLQTYHQRPITKQDPDDSIKWGGGKSAVQMGAKVLEDPYSKQMYITTAAGENIFISSGFPPKFKPSASQILQQATNFGRGPTAFITGSPLSPKITMFTSFDMSATRKWSAVQINNMSDFKHVMENDQARFDQSSGAYSGWRGQASINPFINRSADLWADFSDAERWVAGHVADALVPTLETLMDAVVPFSGAIAHFTGLDQPLEKGISNLKNKMKTDDVWQSGQQYDLDMSNLISDPRLPAFYHKIALQNSELQGANDFSNLPQQNNAQLIKKANMMQDENENVEVQTQANNLEATMERLKTALPSNSYIDPDQFRNVMQNAGTFQQKQNVINFFKKQLSDKVLPFIQNDPSLLMSPTDPMVNQGNPVMQGNNTLTFQQGEQTINGDYNHPYDKVTFRG